MLAALRRAPGNARPCRTGPSSNGATPMFCYSFRLARPRLFFRVFASSARLNRPPAARIAPQVPATERAREAASPSLRFPGSARLVRGSGRSGHALTEPASYHIPPAYASPLIGTNPAKGADLRCLETAAEGRRASLSAEGINLS